MAVSIQDLLSQLGQSTDTQTVGELIEAERERLGISQRQLSRALDVERRSLQRVLNGETKSIDASMLTKISVFLNKDLTDLIQVHLVEQGEEEEIRNVKKAAFLLRQFDLPGLRDLGLTETAADLDHVAGRIKQFFGYDSIYEFAEELPPALHSEVDYGVSHRMQRLWASAVHKQFSEIHNPHEFDREQVSELAKQIRGYTTDVEYGFLRFARRLFQCGVTLIVESYVSKSAVYGATMPVNSRPCIVLTNRDNRYDLLWRTLAHELAHVIVHLNRVKNQGYHLTGGDTLRDEEMEEQANQFASDVFVPKRIREEVRPHIHSKAVVDRMAKKANVHPSLIYGVYLDRDLKDASEEFRRKEYSRFRSNHLISADKPLSKFHHFDKSTWKRESLDETVPLIQETLNPSQKTKQGTKS